MTTHELHRLDTLSEAIGLLRDGFPLDDDIRQRLTALGEDPDTLIKEFGYACEHDTDVHP